MQSDAWSTLGLRASFHAVRFHNMLHTIRQVRKDALELVIELCRKRVVIAEDDIAASDDGLTLGRKEVALQAKLVTTTSLKHIPARMPLISIPV